MDQQNIRRYQGCLLTPPLWKDHQLRGCKQFLLSNEVAKSSLVIGELPKRLGKLAEQFIFHQLRRQNDIRWVGDNIQIQRPDRSTLGELDALFYRGKQLIHLEVAYKFYLYDTAIDYLSPEAYWIGPNRKDSLVDKLAKLKTKQFLLLFDELTQAHLKVLGVDTTEVSQQVCLKGQLFLPFGDEERAINPLQQNCVAGFHLPFEQMPTLRTYSFYLPTKLDWLVQPHQNVEWISFEAARHLIGEHIEQQRSPMLWLKDDFTGRLLKCFVTYWE